MAKYRVPFEGASGSVWVTAKTPVEAQSAAGEVLLGGIEGALQIDVSSVASISGIEKVSE